MEFPRQRFERVGATPEELNDMEAAFDASSEIAQQSFLDRIAPVPDSEIAALLENRRGHIADLPADEPTPEPDPEPASSGPSGSSATKPDQSSS